MKCTCIAVLLSSVSTGTSGDESVSSSYERKAHTVWGVNTDAAQIQPAKSMTGAWSAAQRATPHDAGMVSSCTVCSSLRQQCWKRPPYICYSCVWYCATSRSEITSQRFMALSSELCQWTYGGLRTQTWILFTHHRPSPLLYVVRIIEHKILNKCLHRFSLEKWWSKIPGDLTFELCIFLNINKNHFVDKKYIYGVNANFYWGI